MSFISKYKLTLIGMIIGAIGGYAYYHFEGCSSGSCPITSHPMNSTLYGAVLGALLFTGFKKEKSNNKENKNEKESNNS